MLAARIGYTIAVMAIALLLAGSGQPFGGLVLVPLLAVWLRRTAESGQLAQLAGRIKLS